MRKNRLKIKEFSLLCQVTVKTLRHYEKLGLLRPAEVDEWTGYRYYDYSQMQTLGNIRRLKSIGFSLEEIIELTDQDCLKPSLRKLQEKINDCRQQLSLLEQRHELLQRTMDSQQALQQMDKFTIQSLPEIIVASHREVISDYPLSAPSATKRLAPKWPAWVASAPNPATASP